MSNQTPSVDCILNPISSSCRWLNTILALFEIIGGFFFITYPFMASLAFTWIAGFFCLFFAIVRLVQIIGQRPKRLLWPILYVLVYFFLGAYMIKETPEALGTWTLILGILFTAIGLSRAWTALALRGTVGSGWALFNAIITIALGIVVLVTWPQSSAWLIGTIIGVELLFAGWGALWFGNLQRTK